MPANNVTRKRLLNMYIILNDEGILDYESYLEHEDISKRSFNDGIKLLKEAYNDLYLEGQIIKETEDNPNSEYFQKSKYYLIKDHNINNYSFDIESIDTDKRLKYLYLIVYLMLKSEHYVSVSYVNKMLEINLQRGQFITLIEELIETTGLDIIQNDNYSYELITDF